MNRFAVVALGVGVLGVWSNALGAPLTPPPGAVSATGSTQIFSVPFTITQPGAYRLGRNVAMSSSTNGIVIQSSNVTLDLGGHTLDGANIGIEGIVLDGALSNVTIQNGVIANWLNAGVYSGGDDDINVTCKELEISNIGFGGIEFFNSQVNVRNCAIRTGNPGIAVGQGSIVENSHIGSTVGAGIFAGIGSVISNSTVHTAGGDGIFTGTNCLVKGVTVTLGALRGVTLGDNSVMVESAVHQSGVLAAAASSEDQIIMRNPRTGEVVEIHSLALLEPTVVSQRGGEATPNLTYALLTAEGGAGMGVAAGLRCRIEDCVISNGAAAGVVLGDGGYISDTIVTNNFGAGIVTGFFGSVVRCNVVANFGDGIVVNGEDNLIDGNSISVNLNGIVLNDNFNRVVHNDLSLNSIIDNAGNTLPPLSDVTNSWTNFSD